MYPKFVLSIAVLAVPAFLALPHVQAAPSGDTAEDPVPPGSAVSVPLSGVEAPGGQTGEEPGGGGGTPGEGRTLVLTGQRATAPYSMVGVTWEDPGAGTRLSVRVRTRTDGVWGPWHTLHTHGDASGQAEGGSRTGTEPFWAGPSDGLQVRVGLLSGTAPQGLRAELIDPGRSPADATARATAEEARPPTRTGDKAPKPAIVTRAGWGADESLRAPAFKYTSAVKAAFVHHTGDANDYTCAESPQLIRAIYRYHVQTNGWADIGYNFLVDKCGTVFEGRAGGVDKAVLGAHTLGFNKDTTSVAVLGDFTAATPPGPQAVGAVGELLAWKLAANDLDPNGRVKLTATDTGKYAKGTVVDFDVISAHRDAFVTVCPGEGLLAALPAIRTDVRARMDGKTPVPVPVPVPDGTGATPAEPEPGTPPVPGQPGQPGQPEQPGTGPGTPAEPTEGDPATPGTGTGTGTPAGPPPGATGEEPAGTPDGTTGTPGTAGTADPDDPSGPGGTPADVRVEEETPSTIGTPQTPWNWLWSGLWAGLDPAGGRRL